MEREAKGGTCDDGLRGGGREERIGEELQGGEDSRREVRSEGEREG